MKKTGIYLSEKDGNNIAFTDTKKYLIKCKNNIKLFNKNKDKIYLIAEKGIEELSRNTLKKTGTTANSWDYEITLNNDENSINITFINNNIINEWFNVALFLDIGHYTNGGGYFEGTDYIEDSVSEAFQDLIDAVWKEVT